MSEPADNIPERVARLEHEVAEARNDAAAARLLAGGADRDVSDMRAELRAHTASLHALRHTQVEQGQQMHAGFAEMRAGFAEIRAEMGTGFGILKAGQDHITRLLDHALEQPDGTDNPEEGPEG